MARLESGQELSGRYRLIQRIGSGGMADVWCADDTMLGRRVALKFLHDRFSQDERFIERFRREASAAAGLQHPNVVGVFDRGVHEGLHYIAMEYVEGASLKELIGRGLSVGEAVEIARQVLAGARFAHERGIVHRDLKPQNVLIDADGRARVADFGIAKAGASEITQTGSVLGTAQYLSPEQAQGFEVTAAADLYSIGVVLYEALTGRVPFEGDSAVSVAMKQVSEAPRPPSEHNPAVSRALDAVVLKALAKNPANRFASANEFLAALDAAERDPAGAALGDTAVHAAAPPPPVPPPGRRPLLTRNRAIALALLLAALVAVGAFALTRSESVLVPTVIGKSDDRASELLEEAGFEVATRSVPNAAPEGTVLEQDPTAGSRADEGSTVTITVSLGPGEATVPSVAGLPEREARKELEGRGFLVRERGRPSASVAARRAIGTEPASGTRLERGQTVVLVISTGPKIVTVPSVVGDDQGIAESALRDAGLLVNVETENSDEPEGTVLAQDPGAGSTVEKGTTVTIVVSTGAGSVVVKDVVGQPRRTAVETLTGQGLDVDIVEQQTEDPREDDRVIDQAPDPGTRLHSGDNVTIFVAVFVEPPPEEPPPEETP